MDESRKERCETCRWCETYDSREGTCRRHAPRPVLVNFAHSQNCQTYHCFEMAWPEVELGFTDETGDYNSGDWCGEWQAST